MIEDVNERRGNGGRVFGFTGNGCWLAIKNLSHIAQGYLGRITGKPIATSCAARALYQASSLQLEQDLYEKPAGYPVSLGNAAYSYWFLASVLAS